METNAKLISLIFTPTLTYQCQTWTLIKSVERKIATCNRMTCLRRAVNKTRQGKIRNDIREGQRNGRNNTNPTPYRQRIICFRHLTRMDNNQHNNYYSTRVSGYKARGCPRKTWINSRVRAQNIPLVAAFRLFRLD